MLTKESVLSNSLIEVFENHAQDSRFRLLGNISQTVSATWGMGGNNQPLVVMNGDNVMEDSVSSVVRRLTPLECERLQGYPDGWTDIGDWRDSKGKLHKGDACENVVSREALLKAFCDNCILAIADEPCANKTNCEEYRNLVEILETLPPVTPKPKTGHWINDGDIIGCYYCSECGGYVASYDDAYCKYCGAKMEEVSE